MSSSNLSDLVRQPLVQELLPLGMQWPMFDPFLFCAHHRDAYPRGDGALGPVGSRAGRRIGQDFDNVDGWNLYHGNRIPGFPAHPHRGFETVTYVRTGVIDHSDSLGARARFGQGDTQWLTAGAGIVHCEMFPMLDDTGPNPLELFQIWLNLPADSKMVDPHFTMLWHDQTPTVVAADARGRTTSITVITGDLTDPHGQTMAESPRTPPDSWAARDDADVAIWHLVLDPGAEYTLPAARGDETRRTVYFFEGSTLTLGEVELAGSTGAVVDAQQDCGIRAGTDGAELLVLQGRPIGEPVAQYGPFVMNTETEIRQAFEDYRSTGFGGWPWPSDDPDHGHDWRRFAEHPDGRVEQVS